MQFDLSLKNAELYAGCEVETVAGRDNLKTPLREAINLVGLNAERLLGAVPATERDSITLTGPMAVWAYLVVFHSALHRFSVVKYDDGRNGEVFVAAHG